MVSELKLDPNRIKDEIAWLEDDIQSCLAAMRSAPAAERSEYMFRISADREEIAEPKKKIKR